MLQKNLEESLDEDKGKTIQQQQQKSKEELHFIRVSRRIKHLLFCLLYYPWSNPDETDKVRKNQYSSPISFKSFNFMILISYFIFTFDKKSSYCSEIIF